jgi:hypothetical protein
MSKLLESLVSDAMDRMKSPEVRDALHSNLLAPIMAHVLEVLYPYLIAIVGVWAAILLGIVLILVVLLRTKTAVVGVQ